MYTPTNAHAQIHAYHFPSRVKHFLYFVVMEVERPLRCLDLRVEILFRLVSARLLEQQLSAIAF